MSFKRKTIKITPGSIDLRPPVDQLAETDSMALDGWWPGTAGKLIQNSGWTSISGFAAGVALDSVLQANGAYYYGGAGFLSAVGRDSGSPWYFDSGYDGKPLGMASFQGRAWIMNQAKQAWDDGTETQPWTTETPSAFTAVQAPGASLPVGDHLYYITFIDGHNSEGNPSPLNTVTVTVAGAGITLTRPAAVTSAVQFWNVYHQSPGLAAPYLVNRTPIPYGTFNYLDQGDPSTLQDDQSLLDFDIPMEANHDPAPACLVLCPQTYNGRLVAANSAAHPNRVFYTPALEPGFFPGSNDQATGNWVDVGTDSLDPVLAIGARPGMLLFYRRRSIWRLLGDFADSNAEIDCVVPDLGIVGPRALASTSIADYFVSDQGVFRFNNDWAVKISQKIEPLFIYALAPESQFYTGVNAAAIAASAIGLMNGRLWFSYPGQGQTVNSQTFILHLESGTWSRRFGYTSIVVVEGFGAFLGAGPGAEFVSVSATGHVFQLETGLNDNGAPTSLNYQTGYFDCGFPDHLKTFAELAIPVTTQLDQPLIPTVMTEKGGPTSATVVLPQIPASTNGRYNIPLVYPGSWPVPALQGQPIRGFNLSVLIVGLGSAIQPGTSIDGPMELSYYLEARKGLVFDTGPMNHGFAGAKTLDQVEFEIDASGGAYALQIYSDIPGGVMAARGSALAQTATAGRQVVRVVLAVPFDGRLFRYVLASEFPLQVFSFRARILPIGVYLDGTTGDFLVTRPISVGA